MIYDNNKYYFHTAKQRLTPVDILVGLTHGGVAKGEQHHHLYSLEYHIPALYAMPFTLCVGEGLLRTRCDETE